MFSYFTNSARQEAVEEGKKWDADELIKHRRSIFPRDYDENRKVPREILEKMLESANWAPTHKHTEPWRFIVFGSPESIQRLAQFEADLYKASTPEHKFMQRKYEKKARSKPGVSYVVAICMKRQTSERLPEIEEVCAVACAVQNLHLSAAGHGVGGYWCSGGRISSDEMKGYLGLSEKDMCLGLFYVGYPKPGHVARSHRKPIADKVQWIM
ncbi:hypothetical protein FI667_g11617, partial [Globisporangium splendens]